MDVRCRILAVAALAMLASTIACTLVIDDSDADASGIREWYCYGYTLNLEDRSYNPVSYSEISWTVAYSYEGLDDPDAWTSKEATPSFRMDPGANAPFSSFPVFVREDAVVNGEAKTTMMIVHVNPIKTSCYVKFMYDTERGYQYVQFTGYTTVQAGSGYAAPVPSVDPARDGYEFGGWYMDRVCTVPYTESTTFRFTSDMQEIEIYPKWIRCEPPVPETETHCVLVHPVSGLDVSCDGMIAEDGSPFSFVVGTRDGFRFDLSGLAATSTDGTSLQRRDLGDGRYEFSIGSVDKDMEVFLSGYRQYFRVVAHLDGVETVGLPEWVMEGSSLELPLKSVSGDGVKAVAYMTYEDITGSAFIEGSIRILSVDGNVLIMAESVPTSDDKEDGFPMLPIAVAICIVLIAAVAILRRRKEA